MAMTYQSLFQDQKRLQPDVPFWWMLLSLGFLSRLVVYGTSFGAEGERGDCFIQGTTSFLDWSSF